MAGVLLPRKIHSLHGLPSLAPYPHAPQPRPQYSTYSHVAPVRGREQKFVASTTALGDEAIIMDGATGREDERMR
eukprot:754611-Hanusia_phi.AAC.1